MGIHEHRSQAMDFHGLELYFSPELDIAPPKLERSCFSGGRNLSAEERNQQRLGDWDRRRREQFPKAYRMGNKLILPMWTRPHLLNGAVPKLGIDP
jgi:hypothetical protein